MALYNGMGRYPCPANARPAVTPSAPGRSSTSTVSFGAGAIRKSTVAFSSVRNGTASIDAKNTGFTHGDQSESSGAQISKMVSWFISLHEHRGIDRLVI